MKPKIILILLSALIAFSTYSQTNKVDDENLRWEGGFNIGLNNDGYEMDFRGLYFPVQYFGLKIGVGFAGEIQELADWLDDEIDVDISDYATRFKFNPALVLRTPRLVYWKNQDGGFYLFAEPGVVLSPGASGSRNAEVFQPIFRVSLQSLGISINKRLHHSHSLYRRSRQILKDLMSPPI